MKQNIKTLLLLTLWLITPAFGWAAWTAFLAAQDYTNNTTLPAAGPRVPNATQKLSALVDVAIQNDGAAKITRTLPLHTRDDTTFRQNLVNIGAQRGWFIHNEDYRGVSVVAPADALSEIDRMSKAPLAWIKANHHPALPAQPPADITNLVNVRLQIQTQGTGQETLYFLAMYFSLIAAISTLVAAIAYTYYLTRNNPQGQPT